MYNCFIIKTLFHPSKNQLKTVLNFAECSLYSLVTQWPQYVRFRLLQSNALWLYHKIYKISKMQLYNSNYKFTFKIDTISINLLFECVKIVEFNFNSHVFLVMYQEIRFVNQDVFFFLNQEERRQFLISFVSERDWKREHKLEFKMASNRSKSIFRRFDLPFAAVRGLCERKHRWGACRISCKASRRISTHFAGDVWSSYGVGPGLLQNSQWSNWKNASHNIVQVSNQEENLGLTTEYRANFLGIFVGVAR